jgi:hypothetical protein
MVVTRVLELSDGEELVLEGDELVLKAEEQVLKANEQLLKTEALVVELVKKTEVPEVERVKGRCVVEDPRERTIEVRRLAFRKSTVDENCSVGGNQA